MNNELDKLRIELDFHRFDKKGFMYVFFKELYFDIKKFNNLIVLIDNIKVLFKGEKEIPRNITSILFEINSLYQSKLEDVAGKRCQFNISEEELFDYWEKLKFTILDFFDDVYR